MLVIKRRISGVLLGPNRRTSITQTLLLLGLNTKAPPHDENAPANGHFMADYLVTNLGFSKEKAARSSNCLAGLKSTKNPDAVLGFLKDHGFSHAQVQAMVSWYPSLLSSSTRKTLVPNMAALARTGLPAPTLNQIILSNPQSLIRREAVPRILFWRSFLGCDGAKLVRLFRKNKTLVSLNIHSCILPKLALLKDLGFSADNIKAMACLGFFLSSSLTTIKAQLEYTEQLGFSRGSGMFVHGLSIVPAMRKATLSDKIEMFGRLGWSEKDLFSALVKAPSIVCLSEANLVKKMEFFLGVVGLELPYIVSRPVLMLLSLKKRVIPRYQVIQILESKGFCDINRTIFSIMMLPEVRFVKDYVHKYEDIIEGHRDAYLAAIAK